MSMIPIGWDCYNAINLQPAPVPGGRAIALGAWPWAWQDIYVETKGVAALPATHLFVDAVKWLRGGLTDGVIAIPTDSVDYSWYVPYLLRGRAQTDAEVGVAAKDALTAMGFTVLEYSGTTFPTLSTIDVLYISAAQSAYSTVTWNSQLLNFVNNGGALMGSQAVGIMTLYPFRMGTDYAWSVAYPSSVVDTYDGAEAIFQRMVDAGGVQPWQVANWPLGWGGRTRLLFVNGDPEYGMTQDDGTHCLWYAPEHYGNIYQPAGPYGAVAAYTIYQDAGLGQAWNIPYA